MTVLLALVILAGIGLYLLTPDERARLIGIAREHLTDLLRASGREAPEDESFRTAVRARTRWPVVTCLLVVLLTVVFLRMLVGPGAFSDPETLRAWGASAAPGTTQGQWWRLLTSMFVHAGLLHILATMIGLIPLGLILERIVGPVSFAAAFLSAGIVAALVSLSQSPFTVAAGASGAVFGVYGLAAAAALWALPRLRPLAVPLRTMKVVGAGAALFVLHGALDGSLPIEAELAGFVTGLGTGLVLARGVMERKPPALRAAFALAVTMTLVVVFAVPLRGLTDARPELSRITEVERRTAAAYDEAVVRFRKGWETADALAALVEETILPELEAAQARLRGVGKIPQEHRALLAAGQEYLHLRCESWRMRSKALRTSSLRMLQEADAQERSALGVLEGLQAITLPPR